MKKVQILAENIDMGDVEVRNLPSDCHTVVRDDGVTDMVLAEKRVDIFDLYHDLGIKLKKITLSR